MPTAQMTIRRVRPHEAPVLAELGARTFRDAFGPDNDPADIEKHVSATFAPERVAAEMADPDAVFLLACVGPEAIGYAKMQTGEAPACVRGLRPMEIVRLYLDQDRIGRGYGAALMAACIATARAGGCETLWLGVWERNTRAKAFYRRWGFVPVGTHDFVVGSDVQTDLIMELRLRSAPAEPCRA